MCLSIVIDILKPFATEARRLCPDVIIVLGEELSRFRAASKALYHFIRQYSWNGRVERLGFDEVFPAFGLPLYSTSCLTRQQRFGWT